MRFRNILFLVVFLLAFATLHAIETSNQYLAGGYLINGFEPSHAYNWPVLVNVIHDNWSIISNNNFEGSNVLYKRLTSTTVTNYTNITFFNLRNYTTLWMTANDSNNNDARTIRFTCGAVSKSYTDNSFNTSGPVQILLNTSNCSGSLPSNLTIYFEFTGDGAPVDSYTIIIDNIMTHDINSSGTGISYIRNFTTDALSSYEPAANRTLNNLNIRYVQDAFNTSYYADKTVRHVGTSGAVDAPTFSGDALFFTRTPTFGTFAPKNNFLDYVIYNTNVNYVFPLEGYDFSFNLINFTGDINFSESVMYSLNGMDGYAFNSTLHLTNQNVSIYAYDGRLNLTRVWNGFVNITKPYTGTTNRRTLYMNMSGTAANGMEQHITYIYPATTFQYLNATISTTEQIDINPDNRSYISVESSLSPRLTFYSNFSSERHKSYNNTEYFMTYPYSPIGIRILPTINYFAGIKVGLWYYTEENLEYTLSEPELITQFYDSSYNCYEMEGLSYGYNLSAIHYTNTAYCRSSNASYAPSMPIMPLSQMCYYNSTNETHTFRMLATFLTQQPFYAYYINQSNDTNTLYSGTDYSFDTTYPLNDSIREITLSSNGTIICSYTNESMFGIPNFPLGNYSSLLGYPLFIGVYVLSIQFPYASIMLFVLNDAMDLIPLHILFPLIFIMAILGSALNTDSRQSLRAMLTYGMVLIGYLIVIFSQFPVVFDSGAYGEKYEWITDYVQDFYSDMGVIVGLSTQPDNQANWLLSAVMIAQKILMLPVFILGLMELTMASIHPLLAAAFSMISIPLMISVYITISLKLFTILMNQYDKESV